MTCCEILRLRGVGLDSRRTKSSRPQRREPACHDGVPLSSVQGIYG